MDKKKVIMEYLETLNTEEVLPVGRMKNDLTRLLGDMPSINVQYRHVSTINESTGEEIKRSLVDKVEIVFLKSVDDSGISVDRIMWEV